MKEKRLAALAACIACTGFQSRAMAEQWAAPSGLHGGGLGAMPAQYGRLWIDASFFTRAESTETRAGFTVSRPGVTLLSPIFGFGWLMGTNLELEGILPVGTVFADPEGGTGIGNPFIGLFYVMDGPVIRLKAGGGLALPIVDIDSDDQRRAVIAGLPPRGFQNLWLWYPDSLGLVFPVHLEAPIGLPVVFIGDATPFMSIPVRQNSDTRAFFELAPGLGGYLSDDLLLGFRMPVVWQVAGGGGFSIDDRAQVSIEPFIRLASRPVFFSLRLTMPLDEPVGFAFDTGKYWGVNIGLGGGF